MKKQTIFLYVLLFLFLGIFAYACFTLLTTDMEPEVAEGFVEYEQFQEQVVDETTGDDGIYLSYNYEELIKTNPDFDSWLMIPDTLISFPVVHTKDNYYYLDHGFNRKSNIFGCLYYDVVSVPDAENRVIHGHNMGTNRTEMFSTLILFQEQEYAEAHKLAYLSGAPDGAADTYELFAVLNFALEYNTDFKYTKPNFATEEEREYFISYLRKRSIYETEFMPESKILILSTCNRYYGGENRLLLCYGLKEAARFG